MKRVFTWKFKNLPQVESYDLGLDYNFIDIDLDGREEILVLRTGDI